MAVFEVITIGDPLLREKAKPVKKITPNIIKLLKNMADTMYDTRIGVGLAAPQIGISKRVVVIDVGEGIIELINPEIITGEGSEVDTEGCLSVPGVSGKVKRWRKVKVQALDRHSKRFELEAEGLLARALQHEIDHLEGILFVDRAEKLN
ncbi:MAG: peptide deformylase [Syntrophomonadaceae bacterium]|nr:peptide deformylase [Syntrophomonadaceae bacterium]